MPAITIPGTSIKYGWQEREKGWGPGMNTNLLVLGVIAKGQVVSRTTTAPPANPDEGDAYIIPADATGAWSGRENKIAAYFSGAWVYIEPVGTPIYIEDEGDRVVWNGASYTVLSVALESGFISRVANITALRALTGMQANQTVEMVTTGRAGLFRWDSSNLAAQVTADTQMGIYVPPTSDTTGASGAWVRVYSGAVEASWFGLEGGSSAADFQAAVDAAGFAGADEFSIPFDVNSLSAAVDCKGLVLLAHGHSYPSSTRTFVNHGGIVGGYIGGVATSAATINPTSRPTFSKSKMIRREVDGYTVWSPKANPNEGFLEIQCKENVTTGTNSIGGDSATRVTHVRNVKDILFYQHTYSAAGHSPVDTVTRSVGTAEGDPAKFWNVPSGGGWIEFDPGATVEAVSILFLMSPGSSDDVDVSIGGAVVDSISLVQPASGDDWFVYRKAMSVPVDGVIRITNNSAASDAYVAGINCYRPGEDVPEAVVFDEVAFGRNTRDYAQANGAVDYALRRHPDDYAGSDPTGGSYHGGESVVSDNVRLDGGSAWVASTGDIAVARRIEFVTNVNVVWPSDSASVNVVRLNQIGDGTIFKDIRIQAGSMVFDNVWTTMWTTPEYMTRVSGLTGREISGVSSEQVCYDRGNEVRQDASVSFGVRNSWTLYDNERNSNGGPYIASQNGTRCKLYYGPVLFNKGQVGEIHSQQHTEFFGVD